jgi:hypothetical protein
VVSFSSSVTLPARLARAAPLATTLRPTLPTAVTLPALATATVSRTPFASAAAFTLFAREAIRGAFAAPPPPAPPAAPPAPTSAAVELPIDGISPVAEITTGDEERLQVVSSVDGNQTGAPATRTPRSSCQATAPPSWEIEGSVASPWVGR